MRQREWRRKKQAEVEAQKNLLLDLQTTNVVLQNHQLRQQVQAHNDRHQFNTIIVSNLCSFLGALPPNSPIRRPLLGELTRGLSAQAREGAREVLNDIAPMPSARSYRLCTSTKRKFYERYTALTQRKGGQVLSWNFLFCKFLRRRHYKHPSMLWHRLRQNRLKMALGSVGRGKNKGNGSTLPRMVHHVNIVIGMKS